MGIWTLIRLFGDVCGAVVVQCHRLNLPGDLPSCFPPLLLFLAPE